MTEIDIIEKISIEPDINSLSQTERKFIFENYAETITKIPSYQFESFYRLQEDIIKLEDYLSITDIKELLIKKILNISNHIYSIQTRNLDNTLQGSYIFTPIIEDFVPEIKFERKKRKTYSVLSEKRGGISLPKESKYRKPKPSIRIESDKVIRIKFDNPVECVTNKGHKYIAASGEEINIIGIRVRDVCVGFNRNVPTSDYILMGNYNYMFLASDCNNLIDIKPRKSNLEEIYMFNNVKDINSILNNIYNYVIAYLKYTYHQATAIVISRQISHTVGQIEKMFAGRRPKSTEEFRREMSKIANFKLAEIFQYMLLEMPDYPSPIKSKENKEIQYIEENLDITLPYISDIKLMFTLQANGIYDLYKSAEIYGIDSSEFKQEFNKIRTIFSRERFAKEMKVKSENIKRIFSVYKNIVESLFSKARLVEIEKKLKREPIVTGREILDFLTDKEKKIVQTEKERREKMFEAMIANKCPHIKIHRRFRKARSDQDMFKQYEILKGFFGERKDIGSPVGSSTDSPTGTSVDAPAGKNKHLDYTYYIICNNCKFPLICPHIAEATELKMQRKGFNAIKYAMGKYMEKVSVGSSYHCKICHEVIANVEMYGKYMTEADAEKYSTISDDLKTLLWGEIAGIMRYVQTGILVDVSKVISACILTIYDIIFDIEKQLVKSKTNTSEDIMNKKKLFIAIYAYAYLSQLMINNQKNNTSPKAALGDFSEKMFEFRDIQKKLQLGNKRPSAPDYIKFSIMNIVQTKNIIINKIPEITNTFIKDKIIDAFKILAAKGQQSLQFADRTKNIFGELLLDPLYYYFYRMNMLGEPVKRSLEDPADKIEYVLRGNLDQLKKRPTVFEDVRLPEFMKNIRIPSDYKLNVAFGLKNLKPPQFGKIYQDAKPIFNESQPEYIKYSFVVFYSRFKNRLFDKYVFTDNLFSVDFSRYNELFADFKTVEDTLMQYKLFARLHNICPYLHFSKRLFTKMQVGLGRNYDEQGRSHKFDIYVGKSTGRSKGLVETPVSDIVKTLADGRRWDYKVVDRRCSVCDVLYSESDNLSDKKIIEARKHRASVENLFDFYEIICPEGETHEFVGSKCKKCSITYDILNNIFSPAAKEYFDKYYKQYLEDLKEARGIIKLSREESPDVKSYLKTKYESKYAKWNFDFDSVLKMSSNTKINTNLILALGSFTAVDYQDILNGKYVPPRPTSPDHPRILYYESIIQNFIIDYNNVKYFNNTLKPKQYISQLVEDSGLQRYEYAQLVSLPDIFDNFQEKLEYFKYFKKGREIIEFCIQSFAEMCNQLWNYKDSKTKKLRESFVQTVLARILKQQESLTKPGQIKWALFRKEEDIDDGVQTEYNENYDEDAGVAAEDEFEEMKKEDDEFGDTLSPLENNFDVDYEGDNMEDFENDIKLEDSGLTGME